MATNLSDIGFDAPDGAAMEKLARMCFERGKQHRCAEGTYICWPVGQGIEIWAQLNPAEELVGLNPHFAGLTRASAGLTQRITRQGFPLDGGFMSLAQPYGNAPIQGAFSFVFDTPDFWLHKELALPAIQSVQLAAFAQQCALYENEEDYKARISKRGAALPSDAVIPLGMQDANRQPLPEPLASAMICGKIQDVARQVNPVSQAPFWRLKVRTAAGEMDLLADPALLPPKVNAGQVIQSSVWLSGRLGK